MNKQDISQKLQPHQRAVAEAKARQSEPAAERDMLSQKHAMALKAFQVSLMPCLESLLHLGLHVSPSVAEVCRAEWPDTVCTRPNMLALTWQLRCVQHAGC